MKTCSSCKQEKSFENFLYDKSRNRYFSTCKKCAAIKTDNYRKKHPEKWRKNTANHAVKYDKLILEWKSQGCQKCRETRPHTIDAHHINPKEKNFMVGTVRRGIKITTEELKKCIPLCSNCHRDFHYQEKRTRISIEEYVNLKKNEE
jgi:hypothetical protein